MSFSSVRNYFRTQLLDLDPDFKEHKDAFTIGTVAKNVFNKSFHIALSNPSNAITDNCQVRDNISVTVQLLFKGGKTSKLQSSLDAALDKGHDYKLKASNIKSFPVTIKQVIGNSVVPSPLETNDNSIIITVEFTVLGVFSVI